MNARRARRARPRSQPRWFRAVTPGRLQVAALLAVAYIPLLLTHRGMVGADTKTYLYLDPGRLLSRASTMWDPSAGMGTVTHENIGYLWPMGPWYRVFAAVGVPVWVAQRLWTGTLLVLAGLGVRWLLRTLGWSGPGLAVASFAYMLSPYVLQYEARISAILMGFTALPWMIALTVRALRSQSWRHPALFALVAATAGAVNATCMILAALAAVLWLPFAVWGLGETTARKAVATFAKMLVLSVLAAAWWLVALVVEGRYGLNILRYTETVEVVSRTGLAFEVLRGLGNWFFYGRDAIGPWVHPAVEYTQWTWLITVSFALPMLAFIAAGVLRWRHKLYFAGVILVGVALAVGVYPYDHPSPIGSAFKAFATGSTLGLALRSTGRAVPLVALGTGVLLGAGIDALWRRRTVAELEDRGQGRPTYVALGAGGLVGVLILANMAPLWLGQFVDNNLQAPNQIPAYWLQAAHFVGTQGLATPVAGGSKSPGYATRVLEIPGADFSDYRWGATLDPVTPGLTDRPVVGHQLQPAGGAASADLVRALDRRLQEGVLETGAIAPLARKMGVGEVLLRSDLQYERFRTPRPRSTWPTLNPPPAGLGDPVTFGPPVAETPVIPFTDEITLGTPAAAPDPPAVAVFGVDQPESIIRTEPAAEPMILDGDGEGLVDVAASGLLDPSQPVLYAANLDTSPAALAQALRDGADLVVTDTNKLRAQRWGTIRDTYGYTEQPGVAPLATDSADARLPVFPGAGPEASTVAQLDGVADVRATSYGNSVSYDPAERPDQAFDANPSTAWKVGAFGNPVGQRLRVDLNQAVTTGEVTVVQPGNSAIPLAPTGSGRPAVAPVVVQPGTRLITKVTLTFDGKNPVTRTLDLSSLQAKGQQLTFPTRSFKQLDIRIDSTNLPLKNGAVGNGVGFSDVLIGPPATAPKADEVLRLPTELLDEAGSASSQHRLTLIMTRDRANPAETFTADTEQAMARSFDLPAGRSFALSGTARVSAMAPDQEVDRWLGRPDPPVTNSSGRLPGDLAARSSSALDANPSTFWSPALGPQVGTWISVNLSHPVTLNQWTMQVVADGRHSVPTRLRIKVDNQPDVVVDLPAVADRPQENATVSVPVRIPASVGPITAKSRITVTIDAVRAVQTLGELSKQETMLPVGIAELGIPGVTVPAAGTSVPAGCRSDLLTVDGKPIGIRVLGTTSAAATGSSSGGGGLAIQACGTGVDATGALHLGPGPHVLRTTPGRTTGINLDRLVFSSDMGGAALPDPSAAGPARAGVSSPAVSILAQSATSARVQVAAATSSAPFWLVLGESQNPGWSARITGKGGKSLGAPRLIDGYANGWLVTPTSGQALTISMSWKPQHTVDLGLWVSAFGVALCLALAALSPGVGVLRSQPAPRAGRLPEHPTLYRPWRSYDPDIGRPWSIGAVIGSGVVAALLIGWLAGLVVAVLVAVGLRRGRWQAVPAAAAVAAVAVSALFVVQQQATNRYPLILEWPEHFSAVHGLAWVGVALLAIEALLRHVQSRRPRRQ